MSKTKPLHFDVTGQLCILSIDDDEVNLMVVEQLLRPQGWKVGHRVECNELSSDQLIILALFLQVVSALDGDDAYEFVDGDVWPDFVFLDYTLNVGDTGDEVCILHLTVA